jgi:thymidylate synthase (FAD)
MKVGHIDVFEEAEMSVWVYCSRVASHQLVRHRTQHHLQASQRYIDMRDKFDIFVPPTVPDDELKLIVDSCRESFDHYSELKNSLRNEDARYVLPNATMTMLKAKANFTNWRKFIMLRSDQSAQLEIRMISNAVLKLAMDIAPSVFEDLAGKFEFQNEMAEIVPREFFDGGLYAGTTEI